MRKNPITLWTILALVLIGVAACTTEQIRQLTASRDTATTLRSDVQTTDAAIKEVLRQPGATTLPGYKQLTASTSALDKADVVMGKAIDVLNAAIILAQPKPIDDPANAAALQSLSNKIPNPYTPLINLGIPLILAGIASGVSLFKHGKASGQLDVVTDNHADVSADLETTRKALADAKAALAALSPKPAIT